jgi:dihydroorotate dehydrogenase electron transfer subunit
MPFDQLQATVAANRCLGGPYYVLTLSYRPPDGLAPTHAGHFAMIRPTRQSGPLLPRPMSILSCTRDGNEEHVDIFYKVHGQGTALMATLQNGDPVTYLGPLGQPFPALETDSVFLVGGGVGIPPLVYWCREHANKHTGPIQFFMGGRTANDLFYEDQIESAGAQVVFATNNGERGHHGLVTQPFEAALDALPSLPTVLTCGPMPMMQAVAKICAKRNVRCLASLEAYMACGYGVCLGCVVPDKSGDFIRVCMEGPVMDTQIVDMESPYLGTLV